LLKALSPEKTIQGKRANVGEKRKVNMKAEEKERDKIASTVGWKESSARKAAPPDLEHGDGGRSQMGRKEGDKLQKERLKAFELLLGKRKIPKKNL